MNTTRAGFTPTANRAFIPCMGANHKDRARFGNCDGCGWPVAKTDNGRILDVSMSPTGPKTVACWSTGHECNPEIAAAFTASRAAKIEAGQIIKGATVTVVKGRKVPLGTTGTVTWVGEDSWGKARIGFRTETGESFFTAASNVEAVTA
jgi:hypothetical protein